MLDPGRCQIETWASRLRDQRATTWHLGPACRVGPVELGINFDRITAESLSAESLGPQLKWTFLGRHTDAPWSAALVAGATFDLPRSGRTGAQAYVPVSWRASESVLVNLNLGLDWATGSGERTGRGGLGVQWAWNDRVSLVAERHRAFGQWTSRLGGRIALSPNTSVDISVSRAAAPLSRAVTVGLNHEFGR
ncbi:MAG: hypothetical protein KKC85_21730 [Gammaproteobacteria bacterium]|nr:hypothetical protein [Gammaproteobacteria bacterium]MBU1442455.1 hypothetical protein [Gammaproteobacteria bacterium]MBU2289030.1 hypothetical protein [Gammaproteobacteria bacterium]